jgi:hypothetical protein
MFSLVSNAKTQEQEKPLDARSFNGRCSVIRRAFELDEKKLYKEYVDATNERIETQGTETHTTASLAAQDYHTALAKLKLTTNTMITDLRKRLTISPPSIGQSKTSKA